MNARRIARDISDTLLIPYRTIRGSAPVWAFINSEARAKQEKQPLPLSAAQERVVAALKRDGIAVSSTEELFPPGALAALQSYAASLQPYEKKGGKKPFIVEYWEPVPALTLENPFMKIALSDTALGIVNAYMSIWSKLYYVMLGRTLVSGDANAQASQRWHRDFEEIRMCKMFIYLNDVDEGAGPFSYVRGSQLGGKWNKTFPQRPGRGYYPPDGALERVIPASDIFTATGKAGSVIFADTSGLHRGGYAKERERLMFTAGYYSLAAAGKRRYRLPADMPALEAALSAPGRFALHGVPHAG